MNPFSLQDRTMVLAARFVIAALTCGLLYWGREVLMPLALATLIAFMLHPLAVRLQRIRVPRLISVGSVMLLATGLIVTAVWFITVQVASFTNELPSYQKNISQKIGQVQGSMRGGALEKLQKVFHSLEREAKAREEAVAPASISNEPMPVVIESKERWFDFSLTNAAIPLMEPLVTGGLIFVLVALMLLRWEDLRARLVSVMNQNITRTTRAIDDAGKRIARYLAAQMFINGSFGLVIGLGLWALGVPYAGLWGLCAAMFRYVPYLGPLVAAALPIMVSLVTSEGWTQVLSVGALFLTLELVSNNVLEPWLYGWRVGLSEIGVILAAVAWTFLWGTAGLVLAVPLTVCLVVLGEHVPAISFFSQLLGDKPALPLHLRFYQRLLAHDKNEAAELTKNHAKAHGFAKAGDEIIAPALAHARGEEMRGALSEEEVEEFAAAIPYILDRTDDEIDEEEEADAARQSSAVSAGPVVVWPLCSLSEALVPLLQHHCTDLPCRWQVIAEGSLTSEAIGRLAREEEQPEAVCLLLLTHEDLSRTRNLCKKLRHAFPDVHITVAFWAESRMDTDMTQAIEKLGYAKITWTPSETRGDLAPHILDHAREVEENAPRVPNAQPVVRDAREAVPA
ncbi:putative PurR-regulated permease PerM [Roseimicrobium gellanilyticum]|uniref:Putative PurR-regulated permease PerM n=1 Tax=Roseimicrobium gellanilyticum TaxID=748857 RepID=A0A366HT66_9BACT|nr:AI-2E family transporter [Roseimicrobium gellanilyticum]RBP47462.1 putative PurR-regulated permease PerM [Roseimicrobium gellanilyticum]